MKTPLNTVTNPVSSTTARPDGAAKDNPGDNTGSGMTAEIYNSPYYALATLIRGFREGGLSGNVESDDDPDTLQAMKEAMGMRVSGVADWDSGTSYTTVGTLVYHDNIQWVSFNNVSNLNQEPVPGSAFWYAVPSLGELLQSYQHGTTHFGGMHPMNDRAGSKYQTLIPMGKYRIGGNGGTFYNFYRIALDGSQVTSDADLIAALDVGGANEHPFLDEYAPDDLGTRTLIDMGERAVVAQSDSGESDTIGEEQEDSIQKFALTVRSGTSELTPGTSQTGAGFGTVTTVGAGTGSYIADEFIANGEGDPRTGATTRGKQLVNGASYIISMIPA